MNSGLSLISGVLQISADGASWTMALIDQAHWIQDDPVHMGLAREIERNQI